MYESYSAPCNTVMFSFYSQISGYMRILTDYNNNKMIHIHPPNSTYPNGYCVSAPLDPSSSMVAFEGGRLASSARFLGFLNQGGEPAVFQAPEGGVRDFVRYAHIPCTVSRAECSCTDYCLCPSVHDNSL